ncbi:hypothetical protein [Parabacteroides sp.]
MRIVHQYGISLLQKVVVISLILLLHCSCISKKNKEMSNIEFVPAEFQKVNVNFSEEENECSPYYGSDSYRINILEINAPEKILIKDLDVAGDTVFFPVCIFSSVSDLRALKFENDKMWVYIKDKDAAGAETILSGLVYEKEVSPDDVLLPSWQDEIERQHKKDVAEAIKLTDKELDNSPYSPERLTINLLDYVDFPVQSGKYEVWVTYCNLKSDKRVVEIIIGNEK